MTVGLLTSAVSRTGGGVLPASSGLAQALASTPAFTLRVFGIEDYDTQPDQAAWSGLKVSADRVLGPRRFGYAPELAGRLFQEDVERDPQVDRRRDGENQYLNAAYIDATKSCRLSISADGIHRAAKDCVVH